MMLWPWIQACETSPLGPPTWTARDGLRASWRRTPRRDATVVTVALDGRSAMVEMDLSGEDRCHRERAASPGELIEVLHWRAKDGRER